MAIDEQSAKDRLAVAVITAAHGLRGELKIKPLTEDPTGFLAYGDLIYEDGKLVPPLTVRSEQKGQLICSIKGVGNRNAAEAMKRVKLFIHREQLPAPDEDEFYVDALIGCEAVDQTGKRLGMVKSVADFGAGDIIEILDDQNLAHYFTFTKEVVTEVDLEARKLTILPPLEVTVAPSQNQDDDSE